jgi:hypothetical protein
MLFRRNSLEAEFSSNPTFSGSNTNFYGSNAAFSGTHTPPFPCVCISNPPMNLLFSHMTLEDVGKMSRADSLSIDDSLPDIDNSEVEVGK